MSRLRDAAGRESPFMMDKMEDRDLDDDSFDGNEEEPVCHPVRPQFMRLHRGEEAFCHS